jgi:DNA repair exonuclease SbcCD ATPase subunit
LFYDGKITEAKTYLKGIKQTEVEIKETEEKIIDINDNKIKAVEREIEKVSLAKEAFSQKGLKNVVLDYLIPRLEDKINNILSRLSDFRVRIDTQKKSADGEGIVEGLYIFISNEMGEEMELNNYSGGEKLRVIVAISEALASLHKSIGFRIMDETIVGLSPEMVQDFVEVLEGLQAEYPQVLFISHLNEIKSMFEKTITIKKHNGNSIIEYAK